MCSHVCSIECGRASWRPGDGRPGPTARAAAARARRPTATPSAVWRVRVRPRSVDAVSVTRVEKLSGVTDRGQKRS